MSWFSFSMFSNKLPLTIIIIVDYVHTHIHGPFLNPVCLHDRVSQNTWGITCHNFFFLYILICWNDSDSVILYSLTIIVHRLAITSRLISSYKVVLYTCAVGLRWSDKLLTHWWFSTFSWLVKILNYLFMNLWSATNLVIALYIGVQECNQVSYVLLTDNSHECSGTFITRLSLT